MLPTELKTKYIGSIDADRIHISTNIPHMNPLIASAVLIPVIKYKKKKKHETSTVMSRSSPPTPELITIPWILPAPVSSGQAFTHFYQGMILEKQQSRLTIRVDWRDGKDYKLPPFFSKAKCAIKLDGLMSIAAMKYYGDKGITLDPYMIAFSEDEARAKIKWAKRFWFWDDEKPIPTFIIEYKAKLKLDTKPGASNTMDYADLTPYVDPRPYENWMFSAILSSYYGQVWLPFPEEEMNEYLMERSPKLFVDGPEWISRIYQRGATVETPWAEGTRTIIIKEMLEKKLIPNEKVILESIRCKCGKCLECFFNIAMLNNLGMDSGKLYPYGFNNPELVNKFRKMVELGKMEKNMITELNGILEA